MMLDADERAALIGQGNAAFIELLTRLYQAETTTNSKKTKKSDFHVNGQFLTLLDRHKIYATLDEVADLYVNDEKKMVLDFSESRELAVLQPPTKQRPMEYTGIRWSLFKSPNRHLAHDQDFCYLEIMKPYTAQSGVRGWAKCSHSIETRICPDLSATQKVNRGTLHYCGVFFQETNEPGVLDGIFYYNVDRRKIPTLLAPVVMRARGRNNAKLLNHYIKLARMVLRTNAEPTISTVKDQLHTEKRCGACSNRLPKFKIKEKCHFCRAYMCKNCCAIVSRNYRIEIIGSRHACFSCAEQYGMKMDGSVDGSDLSYRSPGGSSYTDGTPPSVDDIQWTDENEQVAKSNSGIQYTLDSPLDDIELRSDVSVRPASSMHRKNSAERQKQLHHKPPTNHHQPPYPAQKLYGLNSRTNAIEYRSRLAKVKLHAQQQPPLSIEGKAGRSQTDAPVPNPPLHQLLTRANSADPAMLPSRMLPPRSQSTDSAPPRKKSLLEPTEQRSTGELCDLSYLSDLKI